MNIKIVNATHLVDEVRILFNEYQKSLGVDLCFQDYEMELLSLPGKYDYPDGRLYLITVDEQLAGCIALRRFDAQCCEMKRLYVRPSFRGLRLGQRLVDKIIDDAKIIGYQEMVLDTLASLESAVSLYRKLGFEEVSPYYPNPLEDVLYFKLKLE